MSIKKSFQDILENLDKEKKYINEEVFENTPQRIEDFYKEFFSGMYVNPYEFLQNTFDVPNNDLIIERNINFYSMCEHHFLPCNRNFSKERKKMMFTHRIKVDIFFYY